MNRYDALRNQDAAAVWQEAILPDASRLPARLGSHPEALSQVRVIEEVAIRTKLGIEPLGWAKLFDGERTIPGRDTDWFVRPMRATERAVIPEEAARALAAFDAAGVRFDRFYWADERRKPELERPISPWTPAQLGGALLALIALPAVAAVASVATVLAPGVAVDPALIGALVHPEHRDWAHCTLVAKWDH